MHVRKAPWFQTSFSYLCFITFLTACVYSQQSTIESRNESTIDLSVIDENRLTLLEWLASLTGFNPPSTTTEKPIVADPPPSCIPCKCGLTNVKNRIIGGQETKENQYPWMAFLTYRGSFYCGASLINNMYVLTAAHCVISFRKNRIAVHFMEHDRTNPDKMKIITRNITRIIRHSKYNTYNYDNDIALLKLDSPISFKNEMRPVCLPRRYHSFTGLDGIVIGWGLTQSSGALADKLQEVTVPILSNKACKKTSYGEERITANMICAGYINEGMKDSCQGDSGGPLHIINNTVHNVVGVVSWGEGCAEVDHPGVYTRVNRFVTWIENNTKDACYCTEVQPPIKKNINKSKRNSYN